MLADLAMRAGQRVAVFDLFGDLDLRRNADRVVTRDGLTALVGAAAAGAPGAVVYGAGLETRPALLAAPAAEGPGPVVHGPSLENRPALVQRLADRHTLLGNPPATLRAVRDPVGLGAALGDLPYPRTRGTPPFCGRRLRKPLRGGGGARVHEWRGGRLQAGTFLQE